MFIFNEDGTIAGLMDKPLDTVSNNKPDKSPTASQRSGSFKEKKFGRLSEAMSVSAMSVDRETKVAFSDYGYKPEPGQTPVQRIG